MPEGENPLVQMLSDLFKQSDGQTQLLMQLHVLLADAVKARQAKSADQR